MLICNKCGSSSVLEMLQNYCDLWNVEEQTANVTSDVASEAAADKLYEAYMHICKDILGQESEACEINILPDESGEDEEWWIVDVAIDYSGIAEEELLKLLKSLAAC